MPLELDKPITWLVKFYDHADGEEKHPPAFQTREEAMKAAYAYYGWPHQTLIGVESTDGQIVSVDEILRFNRG